DLVQRPPIVGVDRSLDDLALLPAGGGHQLHPSAGGDQGGQQGAGGQGLVIRVGVDGEHETRLLEQVPRVARHGISFTSGVSSSSRAYWVASADALAVQVRSVAKSRAEATASAERRESPRSDCTASAQTSGSRLSSASPPGAIASCTPPAQRQATVGVPLAWASSATRPKVSDQLVSSSIVEERISSASCSR